MSAGYGRDDPSAILNVDVWLRIASFVDTHDLTHGLALACRFLYAVANDPYVWASSLVTPCCLVELDHLAVKHPSIRFIDIEHCWVSWRGIELSSTVLTALTDLSAVVGGVTNWSSTHGKPLTYASSYDALVGSSTAVKELVVHMGGGFTTDQLTLETLQEHGADVENLSAGFEPQYEGVMKALACSLPLLHTLALFDAEFTVREWSLLVDSHPLLHNVFLNTVEVNIDESGSGVVPSQPCGLRRVEFQHMFFGGATSATNVYLETVFLPSLLKASAATLEVVAASSLSDQICLALSEMPLLSSLSVTVQNGMPMTTTGQELLAKATKITTIGGAFDENLIGCLGNVTTLEGEWVCDAVVDHLYDVGCLGCVRRLDVRRNSLFTLNAATKIAECSPLKSIQIGVDVRPGEGVDEALALACCSVSELGIPAKGWEAVAATAASSGYLRILSIHNSNRRALKAIFNNLPPGRLHHLQTYYNGGNQSATALRRFIASGGSADYMSNAHEAFSGLAEGERMSTCPVPSPWKSRTFVMNQ